MVPKLLERLTTPTSPGSLLQAVHPDLGSWLPGSRPTATVSALDRSATGVVVELRVASTWGPRPGDPAVVVALDIDGVRHRATVEVVGDPHAGSARRRRTVRVLVPGTADDPVSACLRDPAIVGERVLVERLPMDPGAEDVPAAGPDRAGPGSAVPGSATPGIRTVHFSGSGYSVESGPGDTLLELAEASGLEPTTGCRRGVCHRCATGLVAGTTTNSRDRTVGRPGDTVRICVSTAETDVELNL